MGCTTFGAKGVFSLCKMKAARKYKNISGRLLRRMRVRREWTQEILSEKLRLAGWTKCKRSWLARIETGEVGVKDLHLVFIREVFGEEFEAQFWEAVAASRKEPPIIPAPPSQEERLVATTSFLAVFLASC